MAVKPEAVSLLHDPKAFLGERGVADASMAPGRLEKGDCLEGKLFLDMVVLFRCKVSFWR